MVLGVDDTAATCQDAHMQHTAQIGQDITDACHEMVALADKHGEAVLMEFNGIKLAAAPGDNPQDTVDAYHAEMQRKSDEWHASPAYAEQQRQATLAAEQRRADLADALAKAPAEPDLDREKWDPWLAKQSDGYSRAVFTYAHLWARIMEGAAVNNTLDIKEAERLSRLADVEGITGAMYGMAVSVLRQTWNKTHLLPPR